LPAPTSVIVGGAVRSKEKPRGLLLTGVACRPKDDAGCLDWGKRDGPRDGSRKREWKEPAARAEELPEKPVQGRVQGIARADKRNVGGAVSPQKPKGFVDRGSVQTKVRRRGLD